MRALEAWSAAWERTLRKSCAAKATSCTLRGYRKRIRIARGFICIKMRRHDRLRSVSAYIAHDNRRVPLLQHTPRLLYAAEDRQTMGKWTMCRRRLTGGRFGGWKDAAYFCAVQISPNGSDAGRDGRNVGLYARYERSGEVYWDVNPSTAHFRRLKRLYIIHKLQQKIASNPPTFDSFFVQPHDSAYFDQKMQNMSWLFGYCALY